MSDLHKIAQAAVYRHRPGGPTYCSEQDPSGQEMCFRADGHKGRHATILVNGDVVAVWGDDVYADSRGRRRIAYRQHLGVWAITGSYDEPDNVVIYRAGKVFRTLTVPGYKIWNYAAHFNDIVADIEDERRAS